jgi:hypothetical protein
MEREEILKKAIEKAVKGGFGKDSMWEEIDIGRVEKEGFWTIDVDGFITFAELFFDHEFAKAFWGEDKICVMQHEGTCNQEWECEECMNQDDKYGRWEYHIKQLALSTDRLEYISKF